MLQGAGRSVASNSCSRIKAFDAFLNQVLLTLPGVANVRTSVVLRELKYETALPV